MAGNTTTERAVTTLLPSSQDLSSLEGKSIMMFDDATGIASAIDGDTVKSSLDKAESAYQKPGSGVPKTDLASGVQSSLDKADSAVQDVSGKADKLGSGHADKLASFNNNGNLKDSDISVESVVTKDTTAAQGELAMFDAGGSPVGSGIGSGEVLVKGGSYKDVGVGMSENVKASPYTLSIEPFNHRKSVGGKAGYVRLASIRGRSVKYNQLVQNGNFASADGWSGVNGTIAVNNNVLTLTCTDVSSRGVVQGLNERIPTAHKALVSFSFKRGQNTNSTAMIYLRKLGGGFDTYSVPAFSSTSKETISAIITTTAEIEGVILYGQSSGSVGDVIEYYGVQLHDLTDIFGAGNEPTSVAAFEAWANREYGKSVYRPYSAGSIKSFAADALLTAGFNKWDEVWELGYYDSTTGAKIDTSVFSRTANFIPVFENTAYYYKNGTTNNTRILFYDADKNLISSDNTLANSVFTTPSGCAYITFFWLGTSYAHDICINLSSDKNGTYEPYNGHSLDLSFLGTMRKFSETLLDTYNGKVKKTMLGEVKLKDLEWSYGNVGGGTIAFSSSIDNKAFGNANIETCSYEVKDTTIAELPDKAIRGSASSIFIYVKDSAYTDAATFKAHFTDDDVLIYELAVPVYETIEREMSVPKEAVSTEVVEADGYALLDADVEYVGTADEVFAKKDEVSPALVAGSAMSLLSPTEVSDEFLFKAVAKRGAIVLNKLKGNSVVWNQLIENGDFASASGWIPVSNTSLSVEDNVASIVTSVAAVKSIYRAAVGAVAGHTYFVMVDLKGSVAMNGGYGFAGTYRTSVFEVTTEWKTFGAIFTGASNDNIAYVYGVFATAGDILYARNFMLIDLTQLFNGSVPDGYSVADFKAVFNKLYYPNNTGEILNNITDKLVATGVNQWDEEWEVGGYSDTTGAKNVQPDRIRSKNHIPAFPSTQYRVAFPANVGIIYIYEYDANGNYLGVTSTRDALNWLFTTQAATRFITFNTQSYYGTTYNNDIQIALYDATNTECMTYHPYERHILDLSWVRQIKDASGNLLFPDGMRKAGSAYDEVDLRMRKARKRLAAVKLKDLNWTKIEDSRLTVGYIFLCGISDRTPQSISLISNKYVNTGKYSLLDAIAAYGAGLDKMIQTTTVSSVSIIDSSYSDAAAFKAHFTDDDVLIYELATPVEVDIDRFPDCVPADYGTLAVLPNNADDAVTAPFACDANSPVDTDVLAAIETTIANIATALNKTAQKNADGSYSFV